MTNYEVKMKYTITFESYHDHERLCEELASDCHYNCPMGKVPCPFGSKNCCNITKEDWMNILQEVKEE